MPSRRHEKSTRRQQSQFAVNSQLTHHQPNQPDFHTINSPTWLHYRQVDLSASLLVGDFITWLAIHEIDHKRVYYAIPDMELGHWVTGSMDHLGHLSRPGHRVIILTQCETEFFRFGEKCPKCKTYIWNAGAGYKYSYLLTYLVETRILDKILDRVLEQ